MRNSIKPFFINSNICLDNDDISTSDKYFNTIAGNIGNSYITYSLMKAIMGGIVKADGITSIYRYDFSNMDKDLSIINNNCSHVFLILQDQIRISESYGLQLPFDNLIKFITKINKPIIVAGLGSNSFNGFDNEFYKKLNPDLIKFLHAISEKSEIIGIRGYYTQEVLSKLGINNTQVIGCPSFFETGNNRIINKSDFDKNFKFAICGCVNSKFYKNTKIFLQDEQPQERDIIDIIAFNKTLSERNIKDFTPIINKNYLIHSDIESWKKNISNFNFLFGTRVHGAILALNSGVPSLVTNVDSRAREMCEFLKIPYHPELMNEHNIEKIYQVCDYSDMNKNYPRLYKNYLNFLNKNGLSIYDGKNEYVYIKQPVIELYKKPKEKIFAEFIIVLLKEFIKNIFSIKKDNKKTRIKIFFIKICFSA